jgi:hypothetical protein
MSDTFSKVEVINGVALTSPHAGGPKGCALCDVYLSMMLGTPATAEANLGRDEHEQQREEQRSQDESEGQRYRGRHL